MRKHDVLVTLSSIGNNARDDAALSWNCSMAHIVWLASYPRSGNTWMRFLLANLLKGDAITASHEVANLIPDIHDGIRGAHLHGKVTTIVKTHWSFNTALPLREDVVGVIHLVRNPIDVMESNQSYAMTRSGDLYEKTTAERRQEMAQQFVDAYIANGGHQRFQQFGIGSWEGHTLSWSSPLNAMPKLLVRYEDLVSAPETQLRRIADFLKLQKTDAQIATAIDASTKEAMRRIETHEIDGQIEGLFYQGRNAAAYAAGQRFIERHQEAANRFKITEDQRRRAHQRFGALMKSLGYLPVSEPPAAGSAGK